MEFRRHPAQTGDGRGARVGEAQDGRKLPLNVSDAFARGLKPLADALFSPQGAQAPQNGSGKKAFEIFGVRVKV